MPSYDYKCKNEECKHEFTIIIGINEEVEIKCECGNKDVERIFSVPVFKINMSGVCGKIGK
jgi:putative FmdB family regulatory protein